jgi:hypothetical protein
MAVHVERSEVDGAPRLERRRERRGGAERAAGTSAAATRPTPTRRPRGPQPGRSHSPQPPLGKSVARQKAQPTMVAVHVLGVVLSCAFALHGTTSAGWHARHAALARLRACDHSPVGRQLNGSSFDITMMLGGGGGSGASSDDPQPLPPEQLAGEVVRTPRPEACLLDNDLPAQWDWRAVTVAESAPPVDYTARIRNQFLPLWCGSCWAHAATAVMGARWRIHGAGAVDFSVQVRSHSTLCCHDAWSCVPDRYRPRSTSSIVSVRASLGGATPARGAAAVALPTARTHTRSRLEPSTAPACPTRR